MNIFEIMDKKKHNALGDELKSQDNRQEILNSIKSSDLLVQAKVGDAAITLDDIYNLHVGDVINLNTPKDSDIQLYIESQPWFKGQLGVHKRNVAVQIDDLIETGNYQTSEN